jgi:hypothetical protein
MCDGQPVAFRPGDGIEDQTVDEHVVVDQALKLLHAAG